MKNSTQLTRHSAVSELNVDPNNFLPLPVDSTHYNSKEFEEAKHGLSFLDVFHCNTMIDPCLNSFTYTQQSIFDKSRISSRGSSNVPFIGATGKQCSSSFCDIEVAIEYKEQDLLASQYVKKDMISRRFWQAMRSNFKLMNDLCFNGNEEHKINGLLTHKDLDNKKAVSTVRANKVKWADKSAQEIFKDIMDAYNDVAKATKNNIVPNTLLLSLNPFNEICSRVFNTFSGATILQEIEKRKNVKVKGLPELNDAFEGESDGFIFFNNDSRYVEQLIPNFFETTDPQQNLWTYTVFCHSRYGGLIIRQPKSFVLRYGV